jgi:hypothetical protein
MVFENLASYRRCASRVIERWPMFLDIRSERLRQRKRHGVAAEKVAENIVEDLFTQVLDWSVGDLNNQLECADLVLTKLGLKRLLLEIKRPGSLSVECARSGEGSWPGRAGTLTSRGSNA